jgi:transposase
VPDGLWERIEPLLPQVERRYRYPGRKRVPDRQVLCGILFVLYTAIPWEFLPKELGFGARSVSGAWRGVNRGPVGTCGASRSIR